MFKTPLLTGEMFTVFQLTVSEGFSPQSVSSKAGQRPKQWGIIREKQHIAGQAGRGKPAFFLSLYMLSRQQAYWLVLPSPRIGLPLSIPRTILNQFSCHTPLIPALDTLIQHCTLTSPKPHLEYMRLCGGHLDTSHNNWLLMLILTMSSENIWDAIHDLCVPCLLRLWEVFFPLYQTFLGLPPLSQPCLVLFRGTENLRMLF